MTSNEKVCRPALLRKFRTESASGAKDDAFVTSKSTEDAAVTSKSTDAAAVMSESKDEVNGSREGAISPTGKKGLELVMQKLLRETIPSLASGPLPGPEATLFELGVRGLLRTIDEC